MSSSDASASSGSRGEGSGAGTQSPSDATNPAGLAVDATTESDPLTEAGRPSGRQAQAAAWADDNTREQAPVSAPAGSSYTGGPAFNPGVAAGAYAGSLAGAPQVAPVSAKARGGAARRARLKVSHMGPLSVFRIALTFSLCMFIVLLVAVGALWFVLDSSGVFKSIIDTASTLTSDNKNTVGVAPWLSFGRVMLITVVLGAANVIAFTLLSTIGSLLYNLCSDFVGGIEVTLIER